MKLTLFKTPPPSDAEEDTEVDVAPVMNMFIILVTFLISMAVFTHMAILEFSLPPNVGTGLDQSQGKPKLKLTEAGVGFHRDRFGGQAPRFAAGCGQCVSL